ncbi:MAG: methylated-DNA--[protein]-cysteine S-methyltransferase [Acidimicrobiia bacterium]
MRDLERALRQAELPESNRAAAGLARCAAERGLLDVAYTTFDSPLGRLLLAASPRGLLRLAYEDQPADVILQDLASRVSPRVLEMAAPLDSARRQLEEYFRGRRRSFEIAIDWTLTAGFRRRVLRATARVPFGSLSTYREVAVAAGHARAARAAGNALGANPIPVVVPCHRVVRTGGELGGYTGGLERKLLLLELEGSLPA